MYLATTLPTSSPQPKNHQKRGLRQLFVPTTKRQKLAEEFLLSLLMAASPKVTKQKSQNKNHAEMAVPGLTATLISAFSLLTRTALSSWVITEEM